MSSKTTYRDNWIFSQTLAYTLAVKIYFYENESKQSPGLYVFLGIRDELTKTDRTRTEKMINLGPDWTKTNIFFEISGRTMYNKIFEISDQVRHVGPRTWRLKDPWAPSYIYGVYRNIAVRVLNYYVPI